MTTAAATLNEIRYFRPRRLGPELAIEDAVVSQLDELFPCENYEQWKASSLTIGAGEPDIIVAACDPDVFALTDLDASSSTRILAYLRTVRCAGSEMVSARINIDHSQVDETLRELVDAKAVGKINNAFQLSPKWKNILPDIVSIEAKVSKWKSAVRQAVRNTIFSHRSYIALPSVIALRIQDQPIIRMHGIGIISVSDDHASCIRQPIAKSPKIWRYYYQLAHTLANSVE